MSVLLFIEHSVEVAHGKSSCKFSKTGYLRIGRSRGSQRVGRGGGGVPARGRAAGVEALPLVLSDVCKWRNSHVSI